MLDVGVAKRYLETQMVIFEKTMAPEMKKALTVALDSMAKDMQKSLKLVIVAVSIFAQDVTRLYAETSRATET